MRPTTSCEFPAKKLSRLMSSMMPTKFSPSFTTHAALVVLRHQQQHLRDEFVRFDGDEVELRDALHRLVDGHALQHHRLGQVHAGDDAGAFAVAHQQRVAVDVAHDAPGRGDRLDRVDDRGGHQVQVPHPRPHHGSDLGRFVLLRRASSLREMSL